MALSRCHRLTYIFLLFLGFVLALVVTVLFEISCSEQGRVSNQSGLFFINLKLVRVTNYLFVISTLCMTITASYPGPKSPVTPFGIAISTLIYAIFGFFFVYDLKVGGQRYESRTLHSFNLATAESRSLAFDQLYLLDKIQEPYKCCGLNGYKDYEKTNPQFTSKGAMGEIHPDTSTQLPAVITWNEFLTGQRVNYTVKDECGKSETHAFDFMNRKRPFKGDVPLSCCKEPKTKDCNTNIFPSGDIGRIHSQGCKGTLLKIVQKVTRGPNFLLLFMYPWIVSIYSFILTWAFLCQVNEAPFKLCGFYLTRKPDEESVNPPTRINKNATSFSDESGMDRVSTSTLEVTKIEPQNPLTTIKRTTTVGDPIDLDKKEP